VKIFIIYLNYLRFAKGSFGCVYKATKRRNGDTRDYAIKIIPINSSEDTDDVYNEMQSLQKLSCPFVVSFVESFLYERGSFNLLIFGCTCNANIFRGTVVGTRAL